MVLVQERAVVPADARFAAIGAGVGFGRQIGGVLRLGRAAEGKGAENPGDQCTPPRPASAGRTLKNIVGACVGHEILPPVRPFE